MYLDFSLLKISIVNYNGEKETLMVEHILKPELPTSTLEQIRSEKANPNASSSTKRYEFNLLVQSST
jgi:hypothetical protein